MATSDLRSPIIINKICILVLGIVVMGVGLHSHFNSSWRRIDRTGTKPHKFCEYSEYVGGHFPGFHGVIHLRNYEPCPKIAMELYYVSMIIICFILSTLNLILTFFLNYMAKIVKLTDTIYHVVAAILLLIAAIIYIVSAVQIKNLGIEIRPFVHNPLISINFRTGEKIAAGVLTIGLAIFYFVTATLIGRLHTNTVKVPKTHTYNY